MGELRGIGVVGREPRPQHSRSDAGGSRRAGFEPRRVGSSIAGWLGLGARIT